MSDQLGQIVARVAERLEGRRYDLPVRELAARAADGPPTRSLSDALRRRGKGTPQASPLKVIGELKRRSPSAGAIYEDLDPTKDARALESAGCAALSILTEPDFFGGSLDTLSAARSAVDLPLLRKDFILDVYQVVEARAFGADAVLLLAAILTDDQLLSLRDRTQEMGMEVLAEAHGQDELERLLELDLGIVGVNARDLHTFEVDLPRALAWAAQISADRIAVAESGIRTREDAQRVSAAPVDAALVGEGLMRDEDPSASFARLFGGD